MFFHIAQPAHTHDGWKAFGPAPRGIAYLDSVNGIDYHRNDRNLRFHRLGKSWLVGAMALAFVGLVVGSLLRSPTALLQVIS